MYAQPPGTGKTRTVIETVKLLKRTFNVKSPILVCTYTNVAVDNLVSGLDKSGLDVLRVGSVGRVNPELYHTTLDAKLERHESKVEIEGLKKSIKALKRKYVTAQMRVVQAKESGDEEAVQAALKSLRALSSE